MPLMTELTKDKRVQMPSDEGVCTQESPVEEAIQSLADKADNLGRLVSELETRLEPVLEDCRRVAARQEDEDLDDGRRCAIVTELQIRADHIEFLGARVEGMLSRLAL